MPGTHKKFTHSRPAPGCTAGLRGSAGAANLPAAPGRDSLPNRPAQAGAPASSLVGARGARPRRGAAVHRGGSPTPNCTPARSASGFLRHSSGLGRLRPARLTQSSWVARRQTQTSAASRRLEVRRSGAGFLRSSARRWVAWESARGRNRRARVAGCRRVASRRRVSPN